MNKKKIFASILIILLIIGFIDFISNPYSYCDRAKKQFNSFVGRCSEDLTIK